MLPEHLCNSCTETQLFCRGVCLRITNLGSFHRGPRLACLALCLLSSDNVLSACRPNDERDREEFVHNGLERKMTGPKTDHHSDWLVGRLLTLSPCQGKLPRRKYMNIWPRASRSSLLLCSEITHNISDRWPSDWTPMC